MTPRHYISRLIGIYYYKANGTNSDVKALLDWEMKRMVESEQMKKWTKQMKDRNGDYK